MVEEEFPPLHRGTPGERRTQQQRPGRDGWSQERAASHTKRSIGYELGQVAARSSMTSGLWCWSGRGAVGVR